MVRLSGQPAHADHTCACGDLEPGAERDVWIHIEWALRQELDRLRPLAEVGEVAEELFRMGALDGIALGTVRTAEAEVRFAELVERLAGDG